MLIDITQDEFNMLVDKLGWMNCIVHDSRLDYRKYCNGECGHKCNRPDLHNFEDWLKSKVVPSKRKVSSVEKDFTFTYNTKTAIRNPNGMKRKVIKAKNKAEARQKMKMFIEKVQGEICQELF